jgi:hypothetical protein
MSVYSQDYLETFGGEDGCEWINLHYEVLYAKCIYYYAVGLGFKSMADEKYDQIEKRYKDLSLKLGKTPSASDMVGWKKNALLEALAMRQYDIVLYDKIKNQFFKFKE